MKYVLNLEEETNLEDKGTILKILEYHDRLVKEYKKLQRYADGEHDILYRPDKGPGKPNNKVASPYPSYIVDVATGYFAGKPVTYTASESDSGQELLLEYQSILDKNDEQDQNFNLAKNSLTKKHCFEIVYAVKQGEGDSAQIEIELGIEEPENMIMIYNNGLKEEPIGAVRRYIKSTLDHEQTEAIEVYTREKIIYFDFVNSGLTYTDEEDHIFSDMVPVVEYKANDRRFGVFEKVLTLIDAYDISQSDTVNDIEYFADAYLYLIGMLGTQAEDVEEMKENRVLLLDKEGSAGFLEKGSNNETQEALKKRLEEDIHRLSMVPNLQDEHFSGVSTGIALKFKLWGLEQVGATLERKFKKGIRRRIELITTALNKLGGNFDPTDISMTFTRNIPADTKTEAEVVQILRGIVSSKTLLSWLSKIDDPAEEYDRVQDELEGVGDLEPMEPDTPEE